MTWLKNTKGNPDALLTLAVVSLGVVLLKFAASDISLGTLQFGQLDASVVAAILTPTLASYVARRHSDNITQQNKDAALKDNSKPKSQSDEDKNDNAN